MRHIALSLLSLSLATVAACKSKPRDEPAQKPVEGSAAAAGATAGSAVGSAAPAAGSASAPVATGSSDPAATAPADAKHLLDAAKADGRFSTLLKAIDAAGLTERLSGAGPFTVLAPTDDAFAKVSPKELEALLADKAKLEVLLQRHVLAGAVSSKELGGQKAIKSLGGDELVVDATSGLELAGAKVIVPDLAAANGVIHAIDTVLLPAAKEK
jgi:uncharacterized surface protein with fasciclin (FAS1) repeats